MKIRSRIFYLFLCLVGLTGCGSSDESSSSESQTTYSRLYGYLYWQNGFPLSNIARRPDNWVPSSLSEEPDLIIQTGYYNLRFDTDDLALTGFDASAGSNYIAALNEDVSTFSDAELIIEADIDGSTYTATSAIIEDGDDFNVRLIEAGQYVQRFDHMGLVFSDQDGNQLSGTSYLEITAWPDRVVFTLDLTNIENVSRSKIQITSPAGTIHQIEQETDKVNLAIQPHTDQTLTAMEPSTYISQAYNLEDEQAITPTFSSDQQAIYFTLTPSSVVYSDGRNSNYSEYLIQLDNPSEEEINLPLVFDLTRTNHITGTVMTLVEEDGRPSGHAVQVSKNWHKTDDYIRNHEGSWIRGSSMIPVAANSTRTLKLRIIYGYWDNVGSASHAQLSLIGYSTRGWQWDESAIGTWGESMTFDPYQSIAGAFIADVRPTWTTPFNGSTEHGWTENVGGGDYLIYFDENGDYRWPKSLKTAYRWTGPNMTEVLYSGVSDNDAVRFTYTTQLVRSNDYHRRFQHINYQVLKDINPSRFVYYQMAADYYNNPGFENFYRGDNSGVIDQQTPEQGGNEYLNVYRFDDSWLAIEDTSAGSNSATGYRGLLSRSMTVDGEDAQLYAHTYGRTYGSDDLLFDISASSTTQTYQAGSEINAEIEFIIPAQSSELYWGYDTEFSDRLASYISPWQAIKDEYTYNEMIVSASKGEIIKHYPITIEPNSSNIDVQFTIPAGKGIGHIPVIVQNATAGQALYAEYYQDDSWVAAIESEESQSNHAYYQGYLNADGSMDYVFNIIRPVGSLQEALTVRILGE